MRSLFQFLCVAGCVFLLAACDGPTVFMAGGKLDGTVTEVPDEWRFAEDSGLAQLETRPAEPYSINLAYVQLEGNLYAYAGDTRTNWVEHIEADPLVRIRINDAIYPLRAVRVEDQRNNETVQTQSLTENENQNHPHKEFALLRVCPSSRVSNDPDRVSRRLRVSL